MEKERAERIIKIYNWTRFILLAVIIVLICIGLSRA